MSIFLLFMLVLVELVFRNRYELEVQGIFFKARLRPAQPPANPYLDRQRYLPASKPTLGIEAKSSKARLGKRVKLAESFDTRKDQE